MLKTTLAQLGHLVKWWWAAIPVVILAHIILDPEGAHAFWLAVDKFLNGLMGYDFDETISSRLGRWLTGKYGDLEQWLARVPCAFLSILDPGHCWESIDPAKDVNR